MCIQKAKDRRTATLTFAFATSSTVPLYASLKGTVDPLNNKAKRMRSFKLLSVLSVVITVAMTLPLVFYGASLTPRVCHRVPPLYDILNQPRRT